MQAWCVCTSDAAMRRQLLVAGLMTTSVVTPDCGTMEQWILHQGL